MLCQLKTKQQKTLSLTEKVCLCERMSVCVCVCVCAPARVPVCSQGAAELSQTWSFFHHRCCCTIHQHSENRYYQSIWVSHFLGLGYSPWVRESV
jgi:hypothetical protein